jgi:hypothetical protein
MLTSNDFIIKEDSEYTWVVILNGVTQGSFTSEESARGFVDYLVLLEITLEEYEQDADALYEEFKEGEKEKDHSPSMS